MLEPLHFLVLVVTRRVCKQKTGKAKKRLSGNKTDWLYGYGSQGQMRIEPQSRDLALRRQG